MLADFVAECQKVSQTISGVLATRIAEAQSVNGSDLPMAEVLVGPGTWQMATTGWPGQMRDVTVRFYVAPVNFGLVPDDAYNLSIALLEQVGLTFLNNRTLFGTVKGIEQFGDTGIVVFNKSNVDYWGFEFRFQVPEFYNTFANWNGTVDQLLNKAYVDGSVTGEAHT